MQHVITQKISFDASPSHVYEALMSTEKHAAFTGSPAQISADSGGEWSAYGGAICGRNIELVPGERIVQAWRPASWPAGVYSVVRIDLAVKGEQTELQLTHSALPDEGAEHIDQGWRARYWEPLAKYLGAVSP